MKRIALLILLLWPATALAQVQIGIIQIGSEFVNNTTTYGPGEMSKGQVVIADNGTDPAEGVIGAGADKTKLNASGVTGRWITNANFLTGGVVEPTVMGLYLNGGLDVANFPFGDATEIAIASESFDAIAIDGDAPEASFNKIEDCRGAGIVLHKTHSGGSDAVVIPAAHHNKISHCWTGIEVNAVDAHVSMNRIASVRDYGIRDTVGAVQMTGNHCFGARWAIYCEGGPSRSVNDRFADAHYGFTVKSAASGTHILGGTSEHCTIENIRIEAQRCRVDNNRILVANTDDDHPGIEHNGTTNIVGLYAQWQGANIIIDGNDIWVGAYTYPATMNTRGSTGIYIEQHNAEITPSNRFLGSTTTGETAVRIAADRNGLNVTVNTSGGGSNFNDAGDAVVRFDADQSSTSGTVDVIYESTEIPVVIDNTWTSALQIRTRLNTSPTWTTLTPGQAYP